MANIAYPHPIIGNGNDYQGVDFQFPFGYSLIEEGESKEKKIRVRYKFDLSDAQILKEIEKGNAAYGVEIICADTFVRETKFLDAQGEFYLQPLSFFGSVSFLPKIFVKNPIKNFTSDNFNNEYGKRKFTLNPGDFMAIAPEENFVVDFSRLEIQDMITIEEKTKLPPFVYNFDLEGETMVILMGKELYKTFTIYRKKSDYFPFLIMSVYKDCLVAAFERYLGDPSEQNAPTKLWTRALGDFIEKENIKLSKNNKSFSAINLETQKILAAKGSQKIIQKLGGE